jgi:uncharacterized protein with HEPN domain
MSRDAASLLDIFEAGQLIRDFIAGISEEDFYEDRKTQSAVLHQILILGEATKRISPAYRQAHPEIPWRLMAGMRDVVIHAYESVDISEVWKTASDDIPALIAQIEPIIPHQE